MRIYCYLLALLVAITQVEAEHSSVALSHARRSLSSSSLSFRRRQGSLSGFKHALDDTSRNDLLAREHGGDGEGLLNAGSPSSSSIAAASSPTNSSPPHQQLVHLNAQGAPTHIPLPPSVSSAISDTAVSKDPGPNPALSQSAVLGPTTLGKPSSNQSIEQRGLPLSPFSSTSQQGDPLAGLFGNGVIPTGGPANPSQSPANTKPYPQISNTGSGQSSPSPSPSSPHNGNGGLLGGIVGGATNAVGGVAGGATSAVGGLASPSHAPANAPGPSPIPANGAAPNSSPSQPQSPHNGNDGGLLGGVLGGATSAVGGVVGGATSPTPSPSPNSSPSQPQSPHSGNGGGLLGGVLGGATSVVGGAVGGVTSGVGIPVGPTQAPVNAGGNSNAGPTPTQPSSPQNSNGGGLLGGIVGGATSVVGGAVGGVTSAVGGVAGGQPSDGGVLGPITSVVGGVTSGVLTGVTSLLAPTSILGPGPIVPPILTSVLPPLPTSGIIPIPSPPGPSPSAPNCNDPLLAASDLIPLGCSPPTPTVPTTSWYPPLPTNATSIVSISVPMTTITGSSNHSTSGVASITSLPTTTAASQPAVNSDFSFITSESALAVASITTSVATITDPDQPTTTLSATGAVNSAVSPPPLPSGIPYRIYPKDGPASGQTGYTLISILFNQELNWPFVVGNWISSSQIFAWIPVLISTALNVPAEQVRTFALQVFVPMQYRGPNDQALLGTMWLGYIPTEYISTLAGQMKVRESTFYTGVQNNVAHDLALHVNSGFSLLSITSVNAGNNGGNGGNNGAGVAGPASRARQDAIIGVVSALGAIAVCVLVFLVWRSWMRKRELAHRRLSDGPASSEAMDVGMRPEGRDFDQDSVGGARRRSFYWAEDSLKGFQSRGGGDDHFSASAPAGTAGGTGMRNAAEMSAGGGVARRNVSPAAISAPILRESSLNW
ncbi:hypothetical protein AX17_003686 [Amanita inopinata Kibby_2008]|nr:hypothetical protein AX17_003686 [Amanita inopinata Kibby_2008]